MADESPELQLEDAVLEPDESIDIDNVDKIINAAKENEEEGLDAVREEIGDDTYFKTLRWAYSYHVDDIYFKCRGILPKVPTTNPPNQLLELVDILWGKSALTPEQQKLKDDVLPDLVVLRIIRKQYLEEAAIRRAQKLDKLASKYFNPEMTYAEIYNIRTMVKAMVASLPDLEQIKDQFISDAEALLSIKQRDTETDEKYLIRVIEQIYNYQLITDILGLTQELTGAKDEDKINLQAASELAPGFISDLAEVQDEKMRILNRIVVTPANNTNVQTNETPASIPDATSDVADQNDGGLDIL